MNYIQTVIRDDKIQSICHYNNDKLISKYECPVAHSCFFFNYNFFEEQNMSITTTNDTQDIVYYNNRGQEVQKINYDYPEGNKVETFTEYYDNGLIKSQYEIFNDDIREELVTSREILLPDKNYMYEIRYLRSVYTERYFKCCDGWMYESFYDNNNEITRTYTDENFEILNYETYDCNTNQLISSYKRCINDKGQCYKTILYEYDNWDKNDIQKITTTQEFKYDDKGDLIETNYICTTEDKNGKCSLHNNKKYIREYRDDGLLKVLTTCDKNNGTTTIDKYEYVILE